MIIRRLTVDDLDPFKSIRLEALRTEPHAFASTYDDARKLSDDDWRARLTNLLLFCAFDEDGAPVGLMGVMRERAAQMDHRGALVMVYVAPRARGAGTARKLLAATEQAALSEGIIQLELHVRADNSAARKFYQNAGYEQYGRLPLAQRTPDGDYDDLLMARRLDA